MQIHTSGLHGTIDLGGQKVKGHTSDLHGTIDLGGQKVKGHTSGLHGKGMERSTSEVRRSIIPNETIYSI